MEKEASQPQPVKHARLRNVRLKDFDKLTNAEVDLVESAFKYLKPINSCGGKTAPAFESMPFSDVHTIRTELTSQQGILKAMSLFYGLTLDEVAEVKIMEFWHARNHLIAEAERLSQLEQKVLTNEPDPKWQEAGGDKLKVFGVFNSIDAIAQRYHVSPLEVETWEYQLVFSILWKQNIEAEINKNLYRKK